MPTLIGNTSGLILRKSSISADESGVYRLSREYSCATSYAATAASSFEIDSAPVSFSPPSGYYAPACVTSSRADGDGGITTFSVEYIGLTSAAYGLKTGTSILSYNTTTETGSGATLVTTQYSGTYAAPTWTQYYISSTGGFVPTASVSGSIRVLQSFVDGKPGSAPSFTTQPVITSLNSTKYGTYYLIKATSTLLITG